MVQPNLGVQSHLSLHIFTVTIQKVFHKVVQRRNVEKNVKEQGCPWKKKEGSSISHFSASDCLEQMHLSCTRHLSSRAHLSVLQFRIILQPPHCSDGNTRQLLLNEKHNCVELVHDLNLYYVIMCYSSERNSMYTRSVSPSNVASTRC